MDEIIKQQMGIMNQQIKELAAVYHDAAAKFGISDNEFWIWYVLILEGECTQQDICDDWSLPKQTVNSIIAKLVKKELLALELLPGTRNRKMIRLTEAGRQYGERIVMHVYQAEKRSLARLTEGQRQRYITLMGEYIEFLKQEIGE